MTDIAKLPGVLQKLFGGLTQEGISLPNGDFESASQAQNTIPSMPATGLDTPPQQSTVQKPSFTQAVGTGQGVATNPGLTTRGKVLATLLQIARGGLEGYGQSQVGNPRDGYPYANAGAGFSAAEQLPFIQSMRRQQVVKSQLENQFQQMSLAQMNMPVKLSDGSSIPLWQAMESGKYDEVQASIGQKRAETSKANAEVAGMPAKQKLEAAQAEAANYKDDPNLGLIDLRTKQPVNNSAVAPLSPEEAQVLGKQPGERVPLKLKNTASEIASRGRTTINTEEGVFDYNRLTGDKKRLGSNPRNIFAPENRFVPVAPDPNNPGFITYERAGVAAKQGAQAPSSAGPQAAKATLKSATSGDIAKQSTAFQTAMQHADLLENATNALANGDTRAMNSIRNRVKTELGSPEVTNWQAIANAYTREITAVLSKGHMTNAEIESAGATIPANASPSQILGAVRAYKALAGSKMNILKEQTQRGMQGQANFPGSQQIQEGQTATGPNGHKIRFTQGQWVDATGR